VTVGGLADDWQMTGTDLSPGNPPFLCIAQAPISELRGSALRRVVVEVLAPWQRGKSYAVVSLPDRRWAVQFGDSVRATLPFSSILLGFLFAGFWWTLNRELTFKAEERHFK
jgi:hypothetical protein